MMSDQMSSPIDWKIKDAIVVFQLFILLKHIKNLWGSQEVFTGFGVQVFMSMDLGFRSVECGKTSLRLWAYATERIYVVRVLSLWIQVSEYFEN